MESSEKILSSRSQLKADRAERKALLKGHLPYLAVMPSRESIALRPGLKSSFEVATYNVHRWTGLAGGKRWNPELALEVLAELDVDVIAIQEALRPFRGEDPLELIAEELGLHVSFVSTRVHKIGELGNALLSRSPMASTYLIDLTLSRIEKRSAVVSQFDGEHQSVAVVATHLALVDRTRRRQVASILESEQLQGPTVVMGDMNAWRRCPATRTLDQEFMTRHDNLNWPPSFPATRPVLALDRIYARGGRVTSLRVHNTPASRRASGGASTRA